MWCQIFTEVDLKFISWISPEKRRVKTDPTRRIRRQIRNAVTELKPDERTSESSSVSECISYIDLFMWIWKISTFSPDFAVTWKFCPNEFSLCPSECMLDECVTMNSLCIFTWKKKNCPRISKSKQRPRPTQLVCNQFEWLWPACIPKCLPSVKQTLYQMLAKELVSVFSTSCYYHVFCHNL